MITAYICAGSNMGRKQANCAKGIARLTQSNDPKLVAHSRFYRTEPVDYAEQDWFVNAVFSVKTALSAPVLLDRLKQVEAELGRTCSAVRFGPRILDLDILLYGDWVIQTPALSIPHPRMHKRRFVLAPFCDIDPEIIHPLLGESMQTLLSRLNPAEQAVSVLL